MNRSRMCADCGADLPPHDAKKTTGPAYAARRRCMDRDGCRTRWFERTKRALQKSFAALGDDF
jgi:hypothetical protein